MDKTTGSADSQTAVLDRDQVGRGSAESSEHPILEALALPVLLLGEDYQITYANRAARESLNMKDEPATCYRVIRQSENPCGGCPVKGLRPGQTAASDIPIQNEKFEMVCRCLDRPIGDSRYVMTLSEVGRGTGVNEEAVRRMKHRFNNYLAPMAGKAEIILFALKKGSYEKVEKAANDILKHAEDSAALDALFDLEPAQESQSIDYYVT